MNHEFTMGNESHDLTQTNYVMLLAKDNKWKGEAINEEKFSKAKYELNDILRHYEELWET